MSTQARSRRVATIPILVGALVAVGGLGGPSALARSPAAATSTGSSVVPAGTPIATAEADYNNDGFADLAIGAPTDTIGGIEGGSVLVLYGGPGGLSTTGADFLHQNRTPFPDQVEANDQFGASLAAADFNEDGFSDLVIGVPGEDLVHNAVERDAMGLVHVIFGSGDGLLLFTAVAFRNPRAGFGGGADPTSERFGHALTVLDFIDTDELFGPPDGIPDLAVSVPNQGNGGHIVNLFDGATIDPAGPSGTPPAPTSSHYIDPPGSTEPGGDLNFGPLIAGDFDGDGEDDLAMGRPFADVGPSGSAVENAGDVLIIFGAGSTPVVLTSANANDVDQRFGSALAVFDRDGDGDDDLVVGAPGDSLRDPQAGTVQIFGLGETTQTFHEDQARVPDTSEPGDQFGFSLAVGNFGRGVALDLAIGVPGQSFGGMVDGGAVDVLYGGSGGLGATVRQRWSQNVAGIPDIVEQGDDFGSAIWAADFGRTGLADLAIGVPGESFGDTLAAGMVHVLYGNTQRGLSSTDDHRFLPRAGGTFGQAGTGGRFGAAVR